MPPDKDVKERRIKLVPSVSTLTGDGGVKGCRGLMNVMWDEQLSLRARQKRKDKNARGREKNKGKGQEDKGMLQ